MVAVVVVDGDAGVLFFFLFLQLYLHAVEQACSPSMALGAGQQAVVHWCAADVGQRLATNHAACPPAFLWSARRECPTWPSDLHGLESYLFQIIDSKNLDN